MNEPIEPGRSTDSAALDRLLTQRFSCRGFIQREVPPTKVQQMFELAQRAPSWCNSQAWQVTLLRGEATARFARALTERALGGPESPDIPGPQAYEGVYQDRRRKSGYGLYSAVGVARDDHDGRRAQMLENFRFFGAPHVAVISTPKRLGTYGAVDCGGYVTTLLLAAQSLGIATIAQAAIARYADLVHDHLDIPTDRDIVCGVSFGYADPAHPANQFRTDRAAIDEVVREL